VKLQLLGYELTPCGGIQVFFIEVSTAGLYPGCGDCFFHPYLQPITYNNVATKYRKRGNEATWLFSFVQTEVLHNT
jgi:hypothetical protein